MTTTATFKKDADGVWGALVPAALAIPGSQVTITKKTGETKVITIATVADDAKKDGRVFCWIAAATAPPVRTRSRSRQINHSASHSTTGGCVTDGNCISIFGTTCGAWNCDQ